MAAMDEVRAVCDAVKSLECSLKTSRETLDAGLLSPEEFLETTRSLLRDSLGQLIVKAIDKRLPTKERRLCIRLPAGAARLPPPVAPSPAALLQGKKGKRGQAEPSSTTRPKRKRRKKTLVPASEPSRHLATDPTHLGPSTPPLETMPPTSFQPCESDPLEVGCLGITPENWNFNPTLSPLCSDASDDDDDDVYKGGGGVRCAGMVDDRGTVKMMSMYHFHPTKAKPPGGVPTKPFRDGRSKKKRNLCAIPPFPALAAVQLGGGFRLDYSEFSKSFKKGRGKGPGRRRKAQKDGVERAMARGAEELLQGLGCPNCKWDRAGCLRCRQRGKRQSGRTRRPPTRLSSDGEWKRTMECDQLKKH